MNIEAMPIKRVSLDKLVGDRDNARRHSERNLDAIKRSLERFGQVEPLIVQKRGRRVVGGNGRMQAMRDLGWTEADCVVLDIDDKQAKALGLALNRTAELAEWDFSQLEALIKDVLPEIPLEDLGFTKAEFEAMLTPAWEPDFDKVQDLDAKGDAAPVVLKVVCDASIASEAREVLQNALHAAGITDKAELQ
jgi:hypothetical protein